MNNDEGEEPFNFSWVVPNLFAGCGFPVQIKHLKWLLNQGITHLVTLNAERSPPIQKFQNSRQENDKQLKWTKISIIDFHSPSFEQIETVMDILTKAETSDDQVCVHCTMGRGRTGSMVACWFIKNQGLTGDEAIRKTREIRPGSIETAGQEATIRDYFQSLNST